MNADDLNLYRGSPRQIIYWVQRALQAGLIPMVQGSPGIGKSAAFRSLAKNMNLFMIDDRVSTKGPEHYSGLPDVSGNRVVYKPMQMFPLEGDPLPKDKDGNDMAGWLYFLDEFNSGLPTTLVGAYKFLAEREVEGQKLHPKCYIVASGNRDEDRAITQSLGTALQRRLLWLEMYLDGSIKSHFDAFMQDVAIPQNWNSRLISFLYAYPKYLNNFDPDHTERTFSCPATLEGASNLMDQEPIVIEDAPLYCGQLGHTVGMDLVNYDQVFGQIPTLKDILTNPLTATIPTDPRQIWAMTSILVNGTDKDTIEDISSYVDNFNLEFKVLYWRQIQMKYPALVREPAFRRAFTAIGRYLYEGA
jgi:hypothetical protein